MSILTITISSLRKWVFSHCTGLLRLQRGLLSETVQPMLLAPLAALEAAFASARLKEAERHRYVRMVALRCPHGVYVSLGGALWILIADGIARQDNPRIWMGISIAVLVQNACIFLSALIFRVTRRSGDHSF